MTKLSRAAKPSIVDPEVLAPLPEVAPEALDAVLSDVKGVGLPDWDMVVAIGDLPVSTLAVDDQEPISEDKLSDDYSASDDYGREERLIRLADDIVRLRKDVSAPELNVLVAELIMAVIDLRDAVNVIGEQQQWTTDRVTETLGGFSQMFAASGGNPMKMLMNMMKGPR